MQGAKIIALANLTGKLLLQSGAETSRVESCIRQICYRFGLNAECFVTMTCIITSAKNKEGQYISSIERVVGVGNNLHRIDRIHEVLTRLDSHDLRSFELGISKIRKADPQSRWLSMASYFFGAFFFSFLCKGGMRDALISGLGGILIYFLSFAAKRLKVNSFFLNLVGSFIATLSAFFWYHVGYLSTMSYATIGTLMLLVPGLALTNGIRDLVAGNSLTGISRVAEAILVGTALATGAGFALFTLLKCGVR